LNIRYNNFRHIPDCVGILTLVFQTILAKT
jgi:hypothetical protein